jgi:hypothetical protein
LQKKKTIVFLKKNKTPWRTLQKPGKHIKYFKEILKKKHWKLNLNFGALRTLHVHCFTVYSAKKRKFIKFQKIINQGIVVLNGGLIQDGVKSAQKFNQSPKFQSQSPKLMYNAGF